MDHGELFLETCFSFPSEPLIQMSQGGFMCMIIG